MSTNMTPPEGHTTLSELKEFASFDAGTQRYIRRSLDVAFERADALALWSRDIVESASIRAQSRVYEILPELRRRAPGVNGLEQLDGFIGTLTRISGFDLGQDRLTSFGAYRFLYERLLGAHARPWLPAAFCAAALLPQIHPGKRRALLQSISEAVATAPGWSAREPSFFPEWVDKIDIRVG
ncbi:MAG: hypothetical protein AABY88_01700 [Pseudomonadota bacterium]